MTDKEKYIRALFETGAILVKGITEPPYVLRSGGESRLYIDHTKMAFEPKTFHLLIDALYALMLAVLPNGEINLTSLCNVDSKISAQLCGGMAVAHNFSQMVYKGEELLRAEKGPGERLARGGKASHVALLDDVGTSGQTLVAVAEVIKKTYPDVPLCAFVGLVREPEAFQTRLEAAGISGHWITTLDDALRANFSHFSQAQRETISQERGIPPGSTIA